MVQLGVAPIRANGYTVDAKIYEASDVDYPVYGVGSPNREVGFFPFYPMEDNPTHDAVMLYHPTHGKMALHDSAVVQTIFESFEDQNLNEYGHIGDYYSIIRTSYAPHNSYALAFEGEYRGSNTTLLTWPNHGHRFYPTRGDVFGFTCKYRYNVNDRIGFVFGADDHNGNYPPYPTAYYLRFEPSDGEVVIGRRDYGSGSFEVLNTQPIDPSGLANQPISVEIDWQETITVTASTPARGEFVNFSAYDTRQSSGGWGFDADKRTYNTTDTRVLWDAIYYKA